MSRITVLDTDSWITMVYGKLPQIVIEWMQSDGVKVHDIITRELDDKEFKKMQNTQWYWDWGLEEQLLDEFDKKQNFKK